MNLYHMSITNHIKGQNVARSLLILIRRKSSCDIALKSLITTPMPQAQALCLHRNVLQ